MEKVTYPIKKQGKFSECSFLTNEEKEKYDDFPTHQRHDRTVKTMIQTARTCWEILSTLTLHLHEKNQFQPNTFAI